MKKTTKSKAKKVVDLSKGQIIDAINDLRNEFKRYSTKVDLKNELSKYATKEDLKNELRKYATKEDLKNELSKYATKEDIIAYKDAILVAIESFQSTIITMSQDLQYDNKKTIDNHEVRIIKIEDKVF